MSGLVGIGSGCGDGAGGGATFGTDGVWRDGRSGSRSSRRAAGRGARAPPPPPPPPGPGFTRNTRRLGGCVSVSAAGAAARPSPSAMASRRRHESPATTCSVAIERARLPPVRTGPFPRARRPAEPSGAEPARRALPRLPTPAGCRGSAAAAPWIRARRRPRGPRRRHARFRRASRRRAAPRTWRAGEKAKPLPHPRGRFSGKTACRGAACLQNPVPGRGRLCDRRAAARSSADLRRTSALRGRRARGPPRTRPASTPPPCPRPRHRPPERPARSAAST